MANKKDEIIRLLNIINPNTEEKKKLLQYLNDADESELDELMQQYFVEDHLFTINSEVSKKILHNIHEKIGDTKKEIENARPFKRIWLLRIAAACLISILVSIVYLYIINHSSRTVAKNGISNKVYNEGLAFDRNKAVLTLADGSVIVLDSAKNGTLAKQGNIRVANYNGKLSYGISNAADEETLYNTISTLRGGQYQVQLPDGSEVWLNAESSIRFPTAFYGKERKVEITGEAYFEVAKNKSMPFIVKVNDAQVEVLGTHFDIMAYSDESSVNTTLLEGSIRFINNGICNILKPGQQAQLSKKDNKVEVVNNVDVEEVVAWKNGIFRFKGEDIGVVLRQLTRWYDVEIVYKEKINDLFYAEIPQHTTLPEVLKALELTGKVHFESDGRKIIVSP